MDHLVSAGLWGVGLAWMAPMMCAQMALMCLMDPKKFDWLARIYTRGQIALTGSKWRAVVHPEIDTNRAYLFFQNHTNHLDHCTFYPATPHFKQGVELEEHFKIPVYGWFMKRRGTIPVVRGSLHQMRLLTSLIRAELDRGNSLLVFPEGTRTLDGRLGRFEPGMFRVARMLKAPIVPVAVTGMYRVMRKGSHLIRPGHRVTVYCDKPVETIDLSIKEIPELINRVHKTISERINSYWENEQY
ncbi:MAG: 1-acyl-sn-glycerol-3-phosphate acyltransferase [Deltaproteobacteria bacterium]|nr:1-acyl-sn-glycerol-3-phosphate acyltransferase [Deltaproteobacteria bacterium]